MVIKKKTPTNIWNDQEQTLFNFRSTESLLLITSVCKNISHALATWSRNSPMWTQGLSSLYLLFAHSNFLFVFKLSVKDECQECCSVMKLIYAFFWSDDVWIIKPVYEWDKTETQWTQYQI